ncbi:aminotransferase class V-fold PLP-dependent enzyme [Glaciimonas sp. PAMC28666]|uniref:aminotransferase class V-fold PLP-dependent enzyme n=1 Tax=Glaciimonas sp. PAMC28666 TaxID=2807626 RepID=UPI001962DD9B|nr:aminotransferase class V-fold PLP-dependent enzyme [Glaciimonas sp. PAMC28666]QRX81758.1 aminotransferase class V-fold PLP-dependent enzyme [Glaciimonas sp. PAMC28666]
MTFCFEKERALFPILTRKAQLSSCSQSALSEPVATAIRDYTTSWLEQGMDWVGWVTEVDGAKAEFARLINADPSDIAVMSCVSDITSSIGSAFEFTGDKNEVVVADIDFPSLGHVWLAHERKGAKVKFVPDNGKNCIDLEAYREAINERTRLVSISHVSYYNGFKQDIQAIAALAHSHDALIYVDAYQSVGSMQIDVVRDEIDLLACGAQKFLLGCPGIAFLYVRRDLAKKFQPSNTGWFGRVNPFAFDIRHLDYADGARRFDTGTAPMINACAARAGMQLLNSLNMADVESHLRFLSDIALQEAKSKGLRIASPLDVNLKGATTAIYIHDAQTVERKMANDGFIVSARNDVIRVAPHFYNTEQEVAAAMNALARYA